MVDWLLLSNLDTALGATVLAVATFISTRSANRSVRLAERALLNGLRPILLPSNWSDAPQKVRFMEGKWMTVHGGHAAATDEMALDGLTARSPSSSPSPQGVICSPTA
ncbi:MAG: hypothetical protein M3017_03450 [Actinomycetota bacterium]|nr:hypothetical protein [Actinomycetota bacterium]